MFAVINVNTETKVFKRATLTYLMVFGLPLFSFPGFVHAGSATDDSGLRASTPFQSKDVYLGSDGMISGPPAPRLNSQDYPRLNLPGFLSESRLIIWVLAQQHLYFGSFLLGTLFLITVLELKGCQKSNRIAAKQYDLMAQELLRLVIPVFSIASILGGILLFGLLALYPDFSRYLASIFRSSFMIYSLLILTMNLTFYLYYYTWKRLNIGFSKWIHIGYGIIVNLLGTGLMFLANSWGTFMLSPAGVDAQGRFLGNHWNVVNNALWNPFNVHRMTGNIVFASIVITAYAGYQTLVVKTDEERTYYHGIGYFSFLCFLFALFTIPFAGYWLQREIYIYNQQFGIILFGGLLAWAGVLLVTLMSLLFIAINAYL